MRALLIWLAVITPLVACSDDGSDNDGPSPTQGVDSSGLAALLVEHWDLEGARDPFYASYLGDHRFDARLPPVSDDDVAALRSQRRDLLARIVAFDTRGLSARDRLTYGVLVERLTAEAGLDACDYERWRISLRDNLIASFDGIGDNYALRDGHDAANYLTRVRAMPAAVDAFTSQLVAGTADGEVAARPAIMAVIPRINALAARPAGSWPLASVIYGSDLGSSDQEHLIEDVTTVIADQLAPAYHRLAVALTDQILPASRDVEGLAGLALGAECYAAEIRHHTTLPMTAEELHALGLSEVARIEAAMLALGHQLYGVDTLPEILARLDADPGQGFHSADEILTWVQAIIARARTQVTPLFAAFPVAPLEVVPYPESSGQIAAAYSQSPDGVRPARYYLVAQPPEQQFRWNLEATTYHETIPGHHLEVGRAAELTDLPALRLAYDDTAYVEGWGLYAETLADELDMYSDVQARLGRLSNEALRACRLVIDTGVHALGWSRADAAAYLSAHSLYTGEIVTTEIERYISWPGQALAYKVGELHLLSLRGEVQARDGAAFSLRAFHESVLEAGSLPLTLLAEKVLGPAGPALRPRAR